MANYNELLDFAIEVFGSRGAANTWLNSPAITLNQQRPIDVFLVATNLVLDVLGRIQYGAYELALACSTPTIKR